MRRVTYLWNDQSQLYFVDWCYVTFDFLAASIEASQFHIVLFFVLIHSSSIKDPASCMKTVNFSAALLFIYQSYICEFQFPILNENKTSRHYNLILG